MTGLEALEPRQLLTTINIVASDALATEQSLTDDGQFKLTRVTSDPQWDTQYQTVNLGVHSSTTAEPNDYIDSAGVQIGSTVLFPPGATELLIDITGEPDADTDDENVVFELFDGTDYDVSGGATATVTILDDDSPLDIQAVSLAHVSGTQFKLTYTVVGSPSAYSIGFYHSNSSTTLETLALTVGGQTQAGTHMATVNLTPQKPFIVAKVDSSNQIAEDSESNNLASVSVNVSPDAVDDNYTINEDTTATGNVITGNAGQGVDTDPNGDPLTASLIAYTTNGNLELQSDGSFVYRPRQHFYGDDSFIYQISDGNGGTDQATATIHVLPIEDAPTISIFGSNLGYFQGFQFTLDENGSGAPLDDLPFAFGTTGDTPLSGDWNGDGVDEVGVHRDRHFYLDVNGSGSWDAGDGFYSYGITGDQPLIGDWNGDGVDNIGIHRGNVFYLDSNGDGSYTSGVDGVHAYGATTDVGIAGDWDGDGIDEIGVHRGRDFYLDVNGNFTADSVVTVVNGGVDKINSFGIIGDTALVGDWNGDGIDEIGAYRASSGTFFLDASGDGYWDSVSTGDISFTFGPSGVAPVVGAWADPAMNFGPRHMLLPQNSTSDTVYFMVSDPDNPVSSLTVGGVAVDPTIVTTVNTSGSGAVREATVTSGSVAGTTMVTLTVTDPSLLSDDDFFTVSVSGGNEEIVVVDGGGQDILDDTGSVDFGETHVGEPLYQVIAIENTGSSGLAISPSSLTVPSGFSVVLDFESDVAPGGFVFFTIKLDALSAGTYSGEVSFNNSDSDENPFNFTITGNVVPASPEIEVWDEEYNAVQDGIGSVSFGETTVGNPITVSMEIENVGEEDLELDPSSLTLPPGFSVVTPFASIVAPFHSTTLTIQLDAASPGTFSGEVSFENNDSDEDPFNFLVSGDVIDLGPLYVDLDFDDSSGRTGADYIDEWTVQASPVAVPIADVDADIESTESTLESLTATITDFENVGDEFLELAPVAGISSSYNVATGTLSLTGTASVDEYEAALRAITYNNYAQEPTGLDRTIIVTAYDGLRLSNPAEFLLLFLQDSDGDVTKVEFVTPEDLTLTGIAHADRYGNLDPGGNPDGDPDDEANKARGALIEPAFKGGDRFFPDATVDDVLKGKNVVRVRAHVTNMAVGDSVYFRSFDVDDPSEDEKLIDRNGPDGDDNRGANGNKKGGLRAVNAGNALGAAWGADGAVVEAKVKDLGGGMLVAEVDLVTSYSPGDNYRVMAVPEHLKRLLEEAVTKHMAKNSIDTDTPDPRVSPQLSVWRHLFVEDDSSEDIYGLMQSTTNRQNNRFADAYLEPEYTSIDGTIDTSDPAGGVVLRAIHAAAIEAARQSKTLESDFFWVVYVTNAYSSFSPGLVWGETHTDWEKSVVFTANKGLIPNEADRPVAMNKVTVHEVGHQLFESAFHPGNVQSIQNYYRANDLEKANDDWVKTINIMNSEAIAVPMNNGDASLPGEPNATAGPFDRFYFRPTEVRKMRIMDDSPGK